jgi:hypothetical protein
LPAAWLHATCGLYVVCHVCDHQSEFWFVTTVEHNGLPSTSCTVPQHGCNIARRNTACNVTRGGAICCSTVHRALGPTTRGHSGANSRVRIQRGAHAAGACRTVHGARFRGAGCSLRGACSTAHAARRVSCRMLPVACCSLHAAVSAAHALLPWAAAVISDTAYSKHKHQGGNQRATS